MTRNPYILFTLTSLSLTLFLFYIDEGYYNFNWMHDPGNWIVFLIYSLPLFGCQLLLYHTLASRLRSSYRYLLSSIAGILLTLGLLFSFFHFIQKI